MNKSVFAASAALLLLSGAAMAGERPVGEPVEKYGMEIGGVYLQGVVMDPQDDICGPANGDIHLEADVHALKGNPNGFGKGEWVPYLGVTFELTKPGTPYAAKGALVPMVANDGPHYGANVKLDGAGKYHVAFHFTPPSEHGFYRHTDKETGVGTWWAPFTQEWDFTFVGSAGKKGGY